MIEIFEIVVKEEYILSGQYDPEGRLFLHFTYLENNFTKSMYRELIKDWADILDSFAQLGIPAVYSAIPKDAEKTRKWQTLFGLKPVAENDEAVFYSLEV